MKNRKFKRISLPCIAGIITAFSVFPPSSDAFAKTITQSSHEEDLSVHQSSRLFAQSLSAKQATIKKEWQTYSNARYRFAIDFPKSWRVEKESDNGDGISLYTGNPNVDIRAFASPCLKSCSSSAKETSFKNQVIRLNHSQRANLISGIEDNQIIYKVSFSLKDIEYTFYSKTPKAFFRSNKENLERMGKSLRVLESNTSDNK